MRTTFIFAGLVAAVAARAQEWSNWSQWSSSATPTTSEKPGSTTTVTTPIAYTTTATTTPSKPETTTVITTTVIYTTTVSTTKPVPETTTTSAAGEHTTTKAVESSWAVWATTLKPVPSPTTTWATWKESGCPTYTAAGPPEWFTLLPSEVASSMGAKWTAGPPSDWCSYSYSTAAPTPTGHATGTGKYYPTTTITNIPKYTGAANANAGSMALAGIAAVAALAFA